MQRILVVIEIGLDTLLYHTRHLDNPRKSAMDRRELRLPSPQQVNSGEGIDNVDPVSLSSLLFLIVVASILNHANCST